MTWRDKPLTRGKLYDIVSKIGSPVSNAISKALKEETEEEHFGRQPLPVTVIIRGSDPRDVDYWRQEFMRRSQFKGDMVQQNTNDTFTIYPRAVND